MLFREGRSNVPFASEVASPVASIVLTGFVQADLVSAASHVQVLELLPIVFPIADRADSEGAGRWLGQREIVAAWAGVAPTERRVVSAHLVHDVENPAGGFPVRAVQEVPDNGEQPPASRDAIFAWESKDPIVERALTRGEELATVRKRDRSYHGGV
jgi:hypothetical protein